MIRVELVGVISIAVQVDQVAQVFQVAKVSRMR